MLCDGNMQNETITMNNCSIQSLWRKTLWHKHITKHLVKIAYDIKTNVSEKSRKSG